MPNQQRRYGAVDVHYPEQGGACAALVVAEDTRFSRISGEHTTELPAVDPYRPGQFYLRELPAVTAVLATTEPLDMLVIDGYVDLDPAGRPGLGAHLHERFRFPVIGVAKTPFRTAVHAVAVTRGGASRPLYVTSAGWSLAAAAHLVAEMAGPYRLPDALRRVDALARASGGGGHAPRSSPVSVR